MHNLHNDAYQEFTATCFTAVRLRRFILLEKNECICITTPVQLNVGPSAAREKHLLTPMTATS